jgi:hypothetical protein
MNALGSHNKVESVFIFGIPLIGSHLTDDFQGICKLLGETLDSCLQQTDGDFAICVACNEIPDASLVPSSKKIKYILTKALSRSELEADPRADVSLKRYTLMNTAVDLLARYYFQFDADDLVSANLVSSVRKSANKNGYILNSGYLLDSRTQLLYLFPNPQFPHPCFYELCGSSNIVSLNPTPNEETKRSNTKYLERILWPGHHVAKKSYENEGRAAQDLDFPACIYRANHGSNLYLRLNRPDRTNFMDAVASSCIPLAGDDLVRVKKEFRFLE